MNWIHSILQAIAMLMISPLTPAVQDQVWVGNNGWVAEGPLLVYRAESTKIIELCRASPTHKIFTPILVQGAHKFFLDGSEIASTGDKAFGTAGNYYNSASIFCKDLVGGTKLQWEAFTQTHSLAKIDRYPTIEAPRFFGNFFRVTANVMIPGTLLGLGVLCFALFYGKVERSILVSMLLMCLCSSVTFAAFVPAAFQISLPQVRLQSIADICMWLSFIFTGRIFYLLGYASKRLFHFLTGFCLTGSLMILMSANLDQNQVGSNIALAGIYIFLFVTLFNRNLIGHVTKTQRKNQIFKFLAVLSFIVTGLNDLLMFQIPLDVEPLGPFGFFCCTALLALAVNDKVVETYEERDYLRANLEKEVERKTEDLKKKSSELEEALSTLKTAQADLVQSAKLAALGTLSAGIAHEINNALNYVNGSIEPLNALLKKDQLSDMDKGKVAKLLKLMKEGLDLTFGIIVNLKRHTSVTTNPNEEVQLKEVVDGVLLLLKNKLTGFTLDIELPAELRMQTSRVSLSQILINLLTNSIDAIEEAMIKDNNRGKRIAIKAVRESAVVNITISDSGPGISPELKERIFDPFFTTKAVGKGTGLGLHIVLSEVTKQGGRVDVQSRPGEGATFTLSFPDAAEGMAA